ncbi:MAG: tRNA preQ1(34) S-adenosylmethionine ribosyltransferase-isomerase QueA [Candidatus Ozemobacteraceae bacterium]
MKTALFDYELPSELIAQVPASKRVASRLLSFDRELGTITHRRFSDLTDLIPPGDLLVLNRSRVIPARVFTNPSSTEVTSPVKLAKPAEILFIRAIGGGRFTAMVRPGRRFKPGARHPLPGGFTAVVTAVQDDGLRVLNIEGETDPTAFFRRYGEMPLPPYISSRESAPERYQTVFAKEEGSVAAPTAGLHFDDELLGTLRSRGVIVRELLLHVGIGTFKPIEAETIDEHHMHAESFRVSQELVDAFHAVRERGGKVWACGTTVVRTLESRVQENGRLCAGEGETAIYLKPGHVFLAVDHLITNFHLPRSSLLVLVSAFAGRERMLNVYQEAVAHRYRFFSFGDAMAII